MLNNCLFNKSNTKYSQRTFWDKKMKKQANRIETIELQQKLRQLLDEIGWSLRKLAHEFSIHDEFNDRQDLDPDKEYEKLRKALKRESTKPETLHRYINFIIEQNKSRALYKIPKLPDNSFNEKEKELFKDIGAIAKQFFENNQRNA